MRSEFRALSLAELEARITAYREGVDAGWRSITVTTYPEGSPEHTEWHLGLRDSKERSAYNTRLRKMRLRAARLRGRHNVGEWKALVAEFGGRCVRCGSTPTKLQKDHIVPIYQGGSDSIGNIQPVCATCNSSKKTEDRNWASFRRRRGFGKS